MNETPYRTIPLTHGQSALVDEVDYESLNQFKWRARWDRRTQSFYAMRDTPEVDGTRYPIYMAREILNTPRGVRADHRNHDTLDNRRFNLRPATEAQNHQNSRKRRDNTSGFRGVSFQKRSGKWQARIRVNGTRLYLGCHATPEIAAIAYAEAVHRLHGEFANV
jgi:hypothetical protein